MIERLSHEPASALAEDDGRSDRLQTLEVLRAQLSRTISEGLGQGSVAGQWGEIDNAQIAAFLDGSLSRAEWDAVATRLANDPVARAELAAAAALLDEIQAQPATAPAGLMARAAGVLARVGTEPSAGFGGGGHSSCSVPAFDGVVRLRSRRPGCDRGTDCFEDGWRRRNDRGQAGRRR